ncbi:tetratricopeptide repeat protein [Actinocorallia herbida]|uniref:Tetratricopeptide repeat protein n=1 Tax=Actinocorallia herbida TaxID=58109 RepID=A0A3N1D6Z3_9ACTN|nr:Scr1 family TA system antitoxin-like transcriptional regulator [Actinocorallia herbida]ROO89293.1 tetratricopeptide repeat protein [Actinocorallia herbida]
MSVTDPGFTDARRSVAAFARGLRAVREKAGTPPYRSMARLANCSVSSLATVTREDRLPTWEIVEGFLRACAVEPGDLELWHRRWVDARSLRDEFGLRTTGRSDGPRQLFAARLSRLFVLAGSPPMRTVIARSQHLRSPGREPQLSVQRVSDWRRGISIPTDLSALLALVRALGLVHAQTGGYTTPEFELLLDPEEWRRLWRECRAEKKTQSSPSRTRIGVLPQFADAFVSRQIDAELEARFSRADAAPTQVLTGMGGVGKTQIAAACAKRAWQRGTFEALVWVDASRRATIKGGYAAAAQRLDLCLGDDPDQGSHAFLEWVQASTTPCLIVLDGLRDPADLRDLWPAAAGAHRVIVTTRRRDASLSGYGRQFLDIPVFTLPEAKTYLTAQSTVRGSAETSANLEALAEGLGFLPMALAQASIVLRDLDQSCATYLTRLADPRLRLAQLLPTPDALPDDHHHTVDAVWNSSIDLADRARPAGMAGPLLNVLAMLAPDGVPTEILRSSALRAHLAARDPAPENLPSPHADEAAEGLRVLHRLGLITITDGADSPHSEIRLHRLLQRTVRERLPAERFTEAALVAADALREVWPESEAHPLAKALRENTVALRSVAESALWRPDGAHPVVAHLIASLGAVGEAVAARIECAKVVASAERLLVPDHPYTLTVRAALALWVGEAGDAQAAIDAYARLLADRVHVLGPDHPDTLATRHHLAHWRARAGDITGAITTAEDLLTQRIRLLGNDHPDTLATREALACWTAWTGDPAGAASLASTLLADRVRVLGPDHPDTLATRHHLADWTGAIGDARSAAERHARLLADRQRLLGPRHPDVLASRDAYALWVGEAGDAQAAIDAYARLLADRVHVLGPDHPDTLATRHHLAHWRARAGDITGAITTAEDLLTQRIRLLGNDHPDTAAVRADLARWQELAGLSPLPQGKRSSAGSLALRVLLGARLRGLREAKGISRAKAGQALRASGSKISRMESGEVLFRHRDVVDLLSLYGVTDSEKRREMAELTKRSNARNWWREYRDVVPRWFESYIGLEDSAIRIRLYEAHLVPSLLRTEDYERQVTRLSDRRISPAEIDRRIEVLAARQRLLVSDQAPHYWAIIDEAVLRRGFGRRGGRKMMRAQLRRLIELNERPNVIVQILPLTHGERGTAVGSFNVLRFAEPELPDIVYLEQLTSALYLDRRHDTDSYLAAMETLALEAHPHTRTERILTAIHDEL